MLNKFIHKLNKKIIEETFTANFISNTKEETGDGEVLFIPLVNLQIGIEKILKELEEEKQREELNKPYQKFMFVEDGSVDTDTLVNEMERTNPEIKVVIYRQGANRPELLDIKE